jgi:hypothetical protein
MTALVRTLVECGVLTRKKTGPAHPMDADESRLVKREQRAVAQARRVALIKDAQLQGMPPPVFQRGRPRESDEEEALERKRLQLKLGRMVHQERIKQGMELLRQRSMVDMS